MKRKANVVMLPTKKSRLIKTINGTGSGEHEVLFISHEQMESSEAHQAYHLYFTTDEEIKDGEPSIDISNNTLILKTERGYGRLNLRKIVATTDPELWPKVKQLTSEHSNLSIEVTGGIPKIPTDFIEAYVRVWNEGKSIITEVNLEQEPKRWEKNPNLTPVEDMKAFEEAKTYEEYLDYGIKLRSNGTVIIHPVVETKEEAAKKYIGLPLHRDMDEEERHYNHREVEYDAFIAGWEAAKKNKH